MGIIENTKPNDEVEYMLFKTAKQLNELLGHDTEWNSRQQFIWKMGNAYLKLYVCSHWNQLELLTADPHEEEDYRIISTARVKWGESAESAYNKFKKIAE